MGVRVIWRSLELCKVMQKGQLSLDMADSLPGAEIHPKYHVNLVRQRLSVSKCIECGVKGW